MSVPLRDLQAQSSSLDRPPADSNFSLGNPSWNFASRSFGLSRNTSALPGTLISNSPNRVSLGYLAFPPSDYSPTRNTFDTKETDKERNDDQEQMKVKEEADREATSKIRLKIQAEIRQQQRLQEAAEARRGEEEWVRSGGIIRDAEGRRDLNRTQAIRDELKLREIEKGLVERWEKYEGRWKGLLANGNGNAGIKLAFQDVPWPVSDNSKPVDLDDLTVGEIEHFLLDGLTVRGNRVTRRERVRSSLLRWHPDKMTAVLARVEEQDLEIVKQGIRLVMVCLQHLNTT